MAAAADQKPDDLWQSTNDRQKFIDGIHADCAKVMTSLWLNSCDQLARPRLSQLQNQEFDSIHCDTFVLDCSVPGKLLAKQFGDGVKKFLGDIRERDDLVKIMQRRGKARSLCFATEVAEEGCAIHEVHHRRNKFGQDFLVERLMFPLFDDDDKVTDIMGVVTGCDGDQNDFTNSYEVETQVVMFDPTWD